MPGTYGTHLRCKLCDEVGVNPLVPLPELQGPNSKKDIAMVIPRGMVKHLAKLVQLLMLHLQEAHRLKRALVLQPSSAHIALEHTMF